MQFDKRRLGRTDVEVTTLGLGCATLAGSIQPVSDADAKMIVLAALDAGIAYFDTAPYYGYGRSEHLVGDELRDRSGWVLSTKVGRLLKQRRRPQEPTDLWRNPLPFEATFDFHYDSIMRSYEDSLQRLGLDRIDILYVHDIDVFTRDTAEGPAGAFTAAMDGAYKALDELRRSGDVKAIGLGVNEAQPIADALDHGHWDVFLLAGRYTLLEQAPLASLFPAIAAHGASVVIGGDTWNYAPAPEDVMGRVKAIARVCEAHDTPLAAAALAFPLGNPLVASVIPGPRSPAELNEILRWWRTPVPAGLWSDLKTEKLLDADAPVPT